jgi:hypothetical protein
METRVSTQLNMLNQYHHPFLVPKPQDCMQGTMVGLEATGWFGVSFGM